MRTPRAFIAGLVFAVLGIVWSTIPAVAEPILYLGDARTDGVIDSADVIRVHLSAIGEDLPPSLSWLLSDANNDFAVDESDVSYVIDIILGTARAHPLAGEVSSLPVSFFLFPEPPDLQASESIQSGVASFFYLPEIVVPAATSQDTVQTGSPSFFYLPEITVPQAMEQDAVQRGTPSFFYLPILQYTVDETNAVELGTPSFDRE